MLASPARRLGRSSICRLAAIQWSWAAPASRKCLASSSASPKRRGKREGKTLTVDMKNMPQGLLSPIDGAEDEADAFGSGGYPPVIQQARNNMHKFSHCVLLTRVGGFYELYFEHAEQYGPLLGLKVAARKAGGGRVPMAGFPFFQLDRFLKYLVQDHGKYVAISEETPNDPAQRVKMGGLLHDRQVKRVVTPGTLIDEHFLNPYEHNYLLAIDIFDTEELHPGQPKEIDDTRMHKVGMSWLDLSSGDFFTQSIGLDSVGSAIARILPREIILQGNVEVSSDHLLSRILKTDEHVITYHVPSSGFDQDNVWNALLVAKSAENRADVFSTEEVSAAKLLLDYASSQLPGIKLRLQSPIQRHANEYMNIDRNSLRGLEVLRTMRDGLFKGSLLHAVRRTSTESGARLLAQRLTSPSSSHEEINRRLDLVEMLLNDEPVLEELVSLLRQTCDTLRLVQRFSFGRGDADDLLALSRTISVTEHIVTLLRAYDEEKHSSMRRLVDRFESHGPKEVAEHIAHAIDEEGLMLKQRSEDIDAAETAGLARSMIDTEPQADDLGDMQKKLSSKRYAKTNGADELPKQDEIWVMKTSASPILERLHEQLTLLGQDRVSLEETLRSQLDAQTLTLKFAPGLGHFCHIKGRDTRADLSLLTSAKPVSSSKSTKSFYLPSWTTLGTRIDNVKLRIRAEESIIFHSLREAVIKNLVPLRRNASLLDSLDVAASFARLASELHLTRPLLNHSRETKIFGGRHMMVDAGLMEAGKHFTPNDCHLHAAEKLWLITGPNMAGKSTFLRQTALISILAQTGSFVPAAHAEVGLVDQIFSRVGSADDLSREQSTFMVEMLETAAILRQATPRSFVIMDEVGRGTTPEDGTAVGFAVLKHLREVNRCRALFATHFHKLADMTEEWIGKGLGAYCTDVREEEDGAFRYDHRMRRGVNRASHALKVARLAGMPNEAVRTAREVLEDLKREKASGAK